MAGVSTRDHVEGLAWDRRINRPSCRTCRHPRTAQDTVVGVELPVGLGTPMSMSPALMALNVAMEPPGGRGGTFQGRSLALSRSLTKRQDRLTTTKLYPGLAAGPAIVMIFPARWLRNPRTVPEAMAMDLKIVHLKVSQLSWSEHNVIDRNALRL